MVEEGAHVTGIDISDVVVEKIRVRARELGVQDSCDFQVMDAENLSFAPDSFDVVCGNSVIHHIDLELAYANAAKVLKPQGRAVWREPLGHNPLLNAFRRLTPQMRTDDEHPLVMDDLKLAERWFSSIDARFFHLTTPAAIAFRNSSRFPQVLRRLERIDARLMPAHRTRATPLRVVRGRADGQAGLKLPGQSLGRAVEAGGRFCHSARRRHGGAVHVHDAVAVHRGVAVDAISQVCARV